MHYPLVAVRESGSRLTNKLKTGAAERCWAVQQITGQDELRRILVPGHKPIIVLQLAPSFFGGWDLLSWLAKNSPDVCVIAMVDDLPPEAITTIWNLGARSVLPLDCHEEELIRAVEAFL